MTSPSPDSDTPTRPSSSWRIFAIPGILALVGYVTLYALDARLRVQKGPWEVVFQKDSRGIPCLILGQPALGLSNITVRFVGESTTNQVDPPIRVRFDQPLMPVPFGKTAFDDLMYLPGTLVLQCFGHEVQMLPKGLYLNRKEVPWQSGASFALAPGEKLADLEPPKKLKSRPPAN